MVDIFKDAKETVMPTWMKFINAGDQVQGTYIGKIVGQIDGYGNEQIIYQLLQDSGVVMNVGFGLNKKVFNQDMDKVKFGQIIGIKFKGKVTVKDKFGKMVSVNDFSLFQDPKIVDEKWLAENADNMPEVTRAAAAPETRAANDFGAFNDPVVTGTDTDEDNVDDVPFSSDGSLTNEDKLAVIEKLAKDKLGATDAQTSKDKVMEATGIAYIPVNYEKIIEALTAM